ncbi:MAG: hypothetical protein JXJ19_02345, partial [Elusimicrobia bacterium]|nr:hypothetical protein [Elusimicrobiota bacterium]
MKEVESGIRKISEIVPLVFFLILVSNTFLKADIYISSNTIWTKQDNPHEIKDDTIVEEGVTLIIEAGAHVVFCGSYELAVDGILIATGTVDTPVLFTSSENLPERG